MGVVWHALGDVLTRNGLRQHLRGAFAVGMLPRLAAAVPKWRAEWKAPWPGAACRAPGGRRLGPPEAGRRVAQM
eukprot:937904-Alexandrium_andersonii.AAC.1